jgi:hypothetical protein
MAAIYAVRLFPQVAALDPAHPTPWGQMWVASRIVPFGAHMVVERLKCAEMQTQFVCMLVNCNGRDPPVEPPILFWSPSLIQLPQSIYTAL